MKRLSDSGGAWTKWSRVPLTEMSVADRLTDAPRPGAVPRLTAEQVRQIVALACDEDCGLTARLKQRESLARVGVD
jgi:hypothetical protein